MDSPRLRLVTGCILFVISFVYIGTFPLGAPIFGFGGLMLISGLGYFDLLRLISAAVVVSVTDPRIQLALFGLLLLDGSLNRLHGDEASVGWILLFASWIFTGSPVVSRTVGALFAIAGVFLIAGVWPVTWSWLRHDEPWGRRIARSLLGLFLLHTMMIRFYPVSFDTWAPLILFLPVVGIIWASGLLVSGKGDAAPYRLLVSFETQILAVFILSVRQMGLPVIASAFWAVLLSLACIWSATRIEGGRPRPILSRIVGLGGVATFLAVPGLAGFPYRWSVLSTLLFSSPAGFVGFLLGMILLPLTLRPIGDLLRTATPAPSFIAALLALGGSIILGILPGLVEVSSDTQWLWDYLLQSVH